MINDYIRKEPIEIYIYLWKNQKVKRLLPARKLAIGQHPDNPQSRYNAVPKWGKMGVTVTHTKILKENGLGMQRNMV